MKRVELIIGEGSDQISLDLTQDSISVALQYSIDDIRNIDKKNSNYSKTITLPGTRKNNDAFGNLFDVNSTFDGYNPNLKTLARIVVDSSPVLEGYIQLTKVNKMNNTDLQGNKISYEVIVFDDSVDFIQSIGDKLVEDLNFSEYNHTYNQTSIENAWNNHTYEDVYQYPLMDKIVRGYRTEDFKPAFYHKALLLKIAEDAGEYDDNGVLIPNTGYTLEGSFMTNESDNIDDADFGSYHKEIILWDGDTPTISDELALQREYKAGVTGTTTISLGSYQHRNLNTSFNNLIKNNLNYDTITPDPPYFDNTGGYTFNNAGGSELDFGQWECSNGGKYNFIVKGNFSMDYIKETTAATGNVYSRPDGFSATVKGGVRFSIIDVDTGVQYGSNIGILGNFEDLPSGTAGKSLTNDLEVKISSDTIPLNARVKLVASSYNDRHFGWGVDVPRGVLTTIVNIELKFNQDATAEFFNKTIKEENIADGDEIEISQYLPKEIKQKDIISDIIRRYNVYIRKHPTKPKTLLLDSRDDFYDDNSIVLDWTQKKDYSTEDKISFLSDLQNKEILFTYKKADGIKAADEAEYNKQYTISTGDIYGQKLIDFDNDFAKGTKKIESIFSTTPLVYRGVDEINARNYVVVPSVKTTEEKRKPVLCYWGGLKPVLDADGSSAALFIAWGGGGGIPYSTYPYAGHWNDPYTPTIDIHYGEVTYEFYGLIQKTTNNNLFNRYWRNYINQISNGKLITSKFYLRETDINFIKDNLNSRIFVKDSYYIINKIIDYKPLEDGLTTVELLYIKQGSSFEIEEPASTETFVTTGNYVYISTEDDLQQNTTRSRNVRTLGRRNSVGADSSASITGDDNTIYDSSTNINITGNNNEVGAGVENVIIIGDNQTVNTSNTSIINGTTFTLASPLSGLWERGDGDDSIVLVNSVAPNTSLGSLGSVVTGVSNAIGENANYTGIFGGAANSINITSPIADSDGSFIGCGANNSISARISAIVGGANNNISSGSSSGSSFIGGGSVNSITNDFSSIIGGSTNLVSGVYSSIIGGTNNVNSNNRSVILGGTLNDVSGESSSIIGGSNNDLTADSSVILGGDTNSLTGNNSVIVGGNNITATLDDMVYVPNLRVEGGLSKYSTDPSVITGFDNLTMVTKQYVDTSIVNIPTLWEAGTGTESIRSIGINPGTGLNSNTASGNYSVVVGGIINETSGSSATVIGGSNNKVSGIASSTIGGVSNEVTGNQSAIIGGGINTLSGINSVIVGGNNIVATQDDTVYVPKLVVTEVYIPTGSTDTNGIVGQISYDGSFVYVKTASGWLRSTLSTF